MDNLIFNPCRDRKELKRYGFKYNDFEDWHIFDDEMETEISFGDNGEFIFANGSGYIVYAQIEWLIPIIYDLIKANLLIKKEKDLWENKKNVT